MGLHKNDEDFGQTLGAWGLGSGPYVVLPLLGPSTVRDAVGRVPDSFLEPYPHMDNVPTRNVTRGVDLLDTRAGQIGRAKSRDRVCQYEKISGFSVPMKKKRYN